MTERFQKVTTSQVHQLLIMMFHKTKRRQPSLLSTFVMVSAKTFTAYQYELANYSSAKKNLLDPCIAPYSSKGSEISNRIFFRLVLATTKKSSRHRLEEMEANS